MRYFYIITFDNQIFEIPYSEEKFKSAVNSWNEGGILLLKDVGGGIHGSSISKVLNEEAYDNYTFTSKPKLFVKDGTWYDGQERKFVRRENWKQEELDSRIKLNEPQEEERSPEEIRAMFEKYRPEFMKRKNELSDKFKV